MGPKSAASARFASSPAPKIAVGLVLTVFAAVVYWPFADEALAEMTIQRREGRVVILRGGETIEVKDETSLKPRDVVQTQSAGEAVIRLEDSRLLTLAANSRIRIRDTRGVESQSGSLLAETRDPLHVAFGSVKAQTSTGTVRVDRGVSAARVASYRGEITVSAPGEERLEVSSLFEAAPSVNAVPSSTVPYDIDETDPWDRLYLPEVVTLQEQLDQLTAGLRAQIGKERPGLDYFSALAQKEDVSFLRPYLRRAPVNLLVAFTIADQAEKSLAPAFRRAFSLYDRGATWAIAAAIMDVKLNAVVADLEDIVTVAVASSSEGVDSFTEAAGELSQSGEVPPPGELPIDDPPIASEPPPTGGPTDPPPPTEEPNPPEECQNSVDCIKQDVEEEIQPSPTPTPKPTDDPEDDGSLDNLGSGGLLD